MNGPVLWTAGDAATATGGAARGDWRATGVSIDSRSLAAGDLFVALRGPNHDGHDFIGQALGAGAAAVVATAAPDDAPALIVDDTMTALEGLASAARARSDARIIAVTGSVGKTGTKELTLAGLAALGPTAGSAGNLNNQWGLPLSLARMPASSAYGVFEMGMNHPGEIRPLTLLARPDVAVITTVEAVHAAYFDSIDDIADAKAEILEGLGPNGTAVLNADNRFFDRLAAHARSLGVTRIVAFGQAAAADARLLDCALDHAGSTVMATVHGQTLTYRLSLPGLHWALNSLAVLATVAALGGDLPTAAPALVGVRPLAGRGRRLTVPLAGGASFEIIDESYNASPASVRAAIAVLGQSRIGRGGRRIAVLGDMLELGDDAACSHAALAGALETAGVDQVFTCGTEMKHLSAALPPRLRGLHTANSDALAAAVASVPGPGDVVLVKGSLGSRMAPVVTALRAAERRTAATG